MKVNLAGFNVDAAVLRELEEKAGGRDDITPEVLSAAYARISRDPRPIDEIRKDARSEVEKTRRSNSTIIFKMGHHSVAEHAVFNLDITGVSRYAMEELEKFRLCAYTEKSQRYITLDKDHVVPDEIKGTRFEGPFTDMIHVQNEAYSRFFEKLKDYVFTKHADLASDPKNEGLLEGWAKEDARYITALATESQVGQTINARTLELLLRRFASHPLSEVQALGKEIYDKIADVAPSIVIFHKANERDLMTYPELRALACDMPEVSCRFSPLEEGREVQLVDHTPEGDISVAAALLHSSTDLPYEKCRDIVKGMPDEKRLEIFKASWRNMQFYDSMLREFEYANLTYNIALSAACFGQLKRHRMATITSQKYDPRLGVTVPVSIKETGLEAEFMEIVGRTDEVYDSINKELPLAAPYILTNAHRKRVLVRVNCREMYHISRLWEVIHAQWDIQNTSRAMSEEAKKVMPLTFSFIGGKDRYNEIYREIFGDLPAITEAVLPGSRKIK